MLFRRPVVTRRQQPIASSARADIMVRQSSNDRHLNGAGVDLVSSWRGQSLTVSKELEYITCSTQLSVNYTTGATNGRFDSRFACRFAFADICRVSSHA